MNDTNPYLGFKEGDKIKAFDNAMWRKHGDVGDNEIYYREAYIIELRMQELHYGGNRAVADIRWINTGTISKGHFVEGLRKTF